MESICRRIAPGLCLTPFYRENGLYALSTAMAVGQTEETMQKLVTDTVTQLKNTEAGLLSRLMSQGDRKEELIARVLRARALAICSRKPNFCICARIFGSASVPASSKTFPHRH